MDRNRRPAVFLDRDGTLNEMVYDETHGVMDSPFVAEHLVLKPRVSHFVRSLNELGFLTLVVTNQPGLAKGSLTPARLARIHHRLQDELAHSGARLDGIFFCPHHPEPGAGGVAAYRMACHCRKPAPGLLLQAAAQHRVELTRSFMVGDGLNDVEAGRSAGVTTILVSRLKPEILEQIQERPAARPDHVVRDLDQALAIIGALRNETVAQDPWPTA